MTLKDGHVEFGGWTIHLEAAVKPDPFGYDAAAAKYGAIVYGSSSAEANWQVIDCQVTRITAGLGGRLDQVPGVRADLGRLTASLYDPQRILDANASPFALLTQVGVPVRLTATSPAGIVNVLWSGVSETWTHDLLTGTGDLVASDGRALIAGVNVTDWARPAETAKQRLQAVLDQLPQPMTLLFTGVPTALSASTYSGSLWGVVDDIGVAEQSIVWVDQWGRLRRSDVTGFGQAIAATDCDDGVTSIIYTGLTSVIDDEVMTNIVYADRLNLTEAQKSRAPLKFMDGASATKHGPHSLTNNRLPLLDDAALAAWANRILSLRANTLAAVNGLQVSIHDIYPWVARTVTAMVPLQVGHVLDITLTSRGTPAGHWAAAVAGIAHTITPDEWVVDLEIVDGAQIALNQGYDALTSIYGTTVYSGPLGVRPALQEAPA